MVEEIHQSVKAQIEQEIMADFNNRVQMYLEESGSNLPLEPQITKFLFASSLVKHFQQTLKT